MTTAKTITAQSQSNFSSSFFFLPAEKREAIRRVYAFFRVVDDVVDEEPNPEKQKKLLDEWRQKLTFSYQTKSDLPLLQELQESIRRFDIPLSYFLELLDGCEMDIAKKKYATFAELEVYCYKVASIVGLVCMKIFEYKSPTSENMAIKLGMALQLTNIIRDVGEDLTKNRIYLPQDELERFGVTENDLAHHQKTENFMHLMDFQYQRALTYYNEAFLEFPKDTEKKLLAARIMGVVYRCILEKIRKQKYPVLTKRVRLSFFEKGIILIKVLSQHYLS